MAARQRKKPTKEREISFHNEKHKIERCDFLSQHWDAVFLLLVIQAYVIFVPFSKVEESFGMQSIHDILYEKHLSTVKTLFSTN